MAPAKPLSTHPRGPTVAQMLESVPAALVAEVESAFGSLGEEERRKSMQDALARLPDEERQVVLARFFEGASVNEVALRLGKGEKDVEWVQHAAIRHLRKLLQVDQPVRVSSALAVAGDVIARRRNLLDRLSR